VVVLSARDLIRGWKRKAGRIRNGKEARAGKGTTRRQGGEHAKDNLMKKKRRTVKSGSRGGLGEMRKGARRCKLLRS